MKTERNRRNLRAKAPPTCAHCCIDSRDCSNAHVCRAVYQVYRRDLRAKACGHSACTPQAYWVWAMREARWQINMGRDRLARLAINRARKLRQFCKVIP